MPNLTFVRTFLIIAAVWACEAASITTAFSANCQRPNIEIHHSFRAEAWANRPTPDFYVGESLRLQMQVSTPAYMTIFHVNTSCKVTRLLKNLSMRPAETVDFPLKNAELELIVKPPAGVEAFYFVATRNRFEFLAPGDIRAEKYGMANLELPPDRFYRRLLDALGRIAPAASSVTTLRTTIKRH